MKDIMPNDSVIKEHWLGNHKVKFHTPYIIHNWYFYKNDLNSYNFPIDK